MARITDREINRRLASIEMLSLYAALGVRVLLTRAENPADPKLAELTATLKASNDAVEAAVKAAREALPVTETPQPKGIV